MKKSLYLGASMLAVAAAAIVPASAADMYRGEAGGYKDGPAYVPADTWTGFYLGVNAGGLFENSGAWKNDATILSSSSAPQNGDAAALAATSSFNEKGSGFVGGIQGGYNYQVAPRFVIGFEADIDGTSLSARGTKTVTAVANGNASFQTTATDKRELDYLGTLRARLGILVRPDLLAFATGGFAYGGVQSSSSFNQIGLVKSGSPTAPAFGSGSDDETRVGFTVGGGLEWKISSQWSMNAQYLYYDLGRASYKSGALSADVGPTAFPGVGIVSVSPHTETHYSGSDVRVGINYHVGHGYEPLK